MAISSQQVRLFLDKYASRSYTEAEHQQFIEWLNVTPVAEVEALLEEYDFTLDDMMEDEATDANLVSNIEAALDQYQLKNQHKTKGRVIPLRLISIAAAIALVILSSVSIYLFSKSKQDAVVAKATPTPIKKPGEPGGNKATLTLSDGSTVILDDAGNGKVADQGNAQVTKLANGQLVYTTLNGKPSEVLYNTLTTPRGGKFKLSLPDGSIVWLNTVSSIKYPTAFIGNERKVEITGEAYFEIAHDASKPFKVTINGTEVKVLGTHFNISGYNEEAALKTTLLEGSVQLTHLNNAIKLIPGQQAQVTNDKNIKVINDVNIEEVVAWKNGYFAFNKADLKTVMRQIARWYDMEIVYKGTIPDRQFGGKIDQQSNVTEVLKILAESQVHFTIEDKKIIVRQ